MGLSSRLLARGSGHRAWILPGRRLSRCGRLRRAGWRAWPRRAPSFALALSQTEAMGFAEDGISAHVLAQLCRDLAGAQALGPELVEALDPLLYSCTLSDRSC